MIDLYYCTTPNGHKVTLFLEESGLPYRILPINIGKGAAYEDVTGAEISAVRFQLNAESQQQPAATVAAARSQVSAIARQAVSSQTPAEHAMLRSQHAAACLNASLVADFGSGESLT